MAEEEVVDLTSISILDIAGLSTEEIAEVRGTRFASGIFRFEVSKGELDEKTVDDYDNPGEQVKQFIGKFTLTCQAVHKLAAVKAGEMPTDPASLVGKNFIYLVKKNIKEAKDVETFIGMIKAFAIDVGMTESGPVKDVAEKTAGKVFDAPIKMRKNSNDADAEAFPFLDGMKIKKVAA